MLAGGSLANDAVLEDVPGLVGHRLEHGLVDLVDGTRRVLDDDRIAAAGEALERGREWEAVGPNLVERVANPADGRSAFARITPSGQHRLRAAAPTYLAGIERHFTSHLTPAEVRTVTAALERVLKAAA